MSDGPTRVAQGAQGTAIVEAPTEEPQAPRAVKLPPRPPIPKALQGIAFSISRRWTVAQLARRYGDVFTLNIPVYGRTVVVAEPQLAKQLFIANTKTSETSSPTCPGCWGRDRCSRSTAPTTAAGAGC